MILAPGTRVVTRFPVSSLAGSAEHPQGAVAEILVAPADHAHAYRVRFVDGTEAALRRTQFAVLRQVQRDQIWSADGVLDEFELMSCVIFRCIVGSRAYGLDEDESDVDRRGIYLPPAEMQWSLYGVPEQLDCPDSEECYWELQKFVTLALKANPNVLECLYTPLVEYASPLAQDLLGMREVFLSKLLYQTYNGYVLSQFKKLNARIRNQGQIKWKHAMHLMRLLLAGITALREGRIPVSAEEHRGRLLAIRRGDEPWESIDAWRISLHREFDAAYEATALPDRPDYERVNSFLIRARQRQVGKSDHKGGARRAARIAEAEGGHIDNQDALLAVIEVQPHPLVFVTISGAHLYGFPSVDSDYDLRGVHVLPLDEVIGLGKPKETIERSARTKGIELDLVTHDLAKFIRLMLKPNGYVLEQLLSPLVLASTPEHQELMGLSRDLVTRHHAHHYLGFARRQWTLFVNEQSVKPLLYVYRVLLTGIYLMRTGEVEANIVRLNGVFGLSYLDDLVAQKIGGSERGLMEGTNFAFHEKEYARLTAELEEARDRSTLPDAPLGRDALNDLLLRIRMRSCKE